jgi:hypothetical protein
MAEPLSQQEIERMLRGLTNQYAARRVADAKAFAKVTESSEEIVTALENLANTDPDTSVREAAKFALSQPAHQRILQQIMERRKDEEEKRQAEQAEFAKLQVTASQTETSTVVICPNCKYQNPRGVKFCQNCGKSLTTNCRRCGSPNLLGVVFCGNCGTKLSEATFGIPADEVANWREAFGAVEWIEELGPRTKQLLPQLQSPLDTSKEPVLFLTYGTAANRIQDVTIDGTNIRRGYIGVIATNWRLIFADTDKMKIYSYPYEDIASVEKPEGGGLMKESRYAIHTKSGHHIGIVIHLDAPGMVGFIAGFGSPVTAGHVISHKRRAEEVLKFLNLYFTRIVA